LYPLIIQTVSLPNGPVRLYVPEPKATESLYKKAKQLDASTLFPFWAKIWPSSVAMATFLQTQPKWVTGRKAAEFGAGLGLPSLAIAPMAKNIWCSDHAFEAKSTIQKSIELHAFGNMEAHVCDWKNFTACGEPQVVLMSDVNYAPEAFPDLEKLLDYFMGKEIPVILSTPQRLMGKPFLQKIMPWVVLQEEMEIGRDKERISLFVLG
jgi:predicted nicotinamide N-methyase